MKKNLEITLLSATEVWGGIIWKEQNPMAETKEYFERDEFANNQMDVLKKYGTVAAVTDLQIITSFSNDYVISCDFRVPDDKSLRGISGIYYTKSCNESGAVLGGWLEEGKMYAGSSFSDEESIRPVLKLSEKLFNEVIINKRPGYNGVEEVELGEYPQYAVDDELREKLEIEYTFGHIDETGKSYFIHKKEGPYSNDLGIVPIQEYIYNGKKYVRILLPHSAKLSNGQKYEKGYPVWLEVSPVTWLIDEKTHSLISKRCLLAGVGFSDKNKYNGVFEETPIYRYLNDYMLNDLLHDEPILNKSLSVTEENLTNIEEILDQISDEDREAYLEALKTIKGNMSNPNPPKIRS